MIHTAENTPSNNSTVRELEPEERPIIQSLILELNPNLTPTLFADYLKQIDSQNYRCAGIFVGGQLVGVIGCWIFTRFWCGKQCDIDNVIVTESYRRKGYAKQLMNWAENLAEQENCDILVLDSYRTATSAHAFYETLGYYAKGYHFIKPISASCPVKEVG